MVPQLLININFSTLPIDFFATIPGPTTFAASAIAFNKFKLCFANYWKKCPYCCPQCHAFIPAPTL